MNSNSDLVLYRLFSMTNSNRGSRKIWKFWGPKPVPFEFDGTFYYLGSDVANYLRLFRGKLLSQFPNLKKRKTTAEESNSIYVS